MIPDSPVNAGHAFATAAEDFEDREEWAEAAEAHRKAAEQFQKAIEFAQDNVASRTLSLLTSNHLRKAKELERKVARQKQTVHTVHGHGFSVASADDDENNDDDVSSGPYDMDSLRMALSSDRRRFGGHNSGSATPAIGGSYAVLPTNDEDAADPFNKFFRVVETLVDKLSNPIAFASAPLNENDNPTPAWSTQNDDSDEESERSGLKMQESYFFVAEPTESVMLDSSAPATSDRSHDIANENDQLKQQVDQLKRKIHALEKAAEEGNMLKSSILQFRADVHNHAKRIMQNHDHSAMRASSSVALMGGSMNMRPPFGDHVARIRELEEENRQLRLQNENQQAMVNKYRERWERLKESAKKRRAHPDQEAAVIGSTRNFSTCSVEGTRNQQKQQQQQQQQQPVLLRSLAQQTGLSGIYTRASSSFSKDL